MVRFDIPWSLAAWATDTPSFLTRFKICSLISGAMRYFFIVSLFYEIMLIIRRKSVQNLGDRSLRLQYFRRPQLHRPAASNNLSFPKTRRPISCRKNKTRLRCPLSCLPCRQAGRPVPPATQCRDKLLGTPAPSYFLKLI